MKKLTISVFFLSLFYFSLAYRILGIFPNPAKSHMRLFSRLMKELAVKGHEVTVLSVFPLKERMDRYNDINIKGIVPNNNLSMTNIEGKYMFFSTALELIFGHYGIKPCEAIFASTIGHQLKEAKGKYDLVVLHLVGNECMTPFGYYFEVPLVSIITSVCLPWIGDRIGNPENPSYVTNYFLPYVNPLSLFERLKNTFALCFSKIMHLLAIFSQNQLAWKYFGPNLPDVKELAQNTSLVLVNSYFSINVARPAVPKFVEIGGLHIDPPKPLPQNLESWVISASQYKGVIYLSMGTLISSETFPSNKLQALFEAIRELPYKVLWKGLQKKMPKDLDIPPNIKFQPWLPQVDVLCHPNTKLFITHGGLFSTQESIYCGVPRLGIPFFGDQPLNLKTSESQDLAIVVQYNNITKENILDAARKLLEDPKYKINAERVSRIFKDRPHLALETAVYWIEHVTRHRGAPELRSVGRSLPLYQYFSVDVVLILETFPVATGITIYFIIRYTTCTFY